MLRIDYTNQKMGKLTIIRPATKEETAGRKDTYWYAICDCHGETGFPGFKIISRDSLKNQTGLHCGCEGRKTTFIDLTNKKFNRLTVLEKSGKEGKEYLWKCKCDCDNEIIVKGVSLREGRTKSCGCLKKETDKMPKGNVKNEIGNKYGHLLVVARDGSDDRGQAKWLCECDCGNPTQISVLGNNLRRGHTQSCGCERRSHGEILLYNLLQDNDIPFETEKIMFKFANGANAKFDFWIDNSYLIEYDGETHYNYNLHGWHNLEQLKKQQERDIIKTQWCKDNNIPLIRIPYTHYKNITIEDLLITSSFRVC